MCEGGECGYDILMVVGVICYILRIVVGCKMDTCHIRDIEFTSIHYYSILGKYIRTVDWIL